MEESVFRRELERYRPVRRSDYFKPQVKERKAPPLIASPPAGLNPHKSGSTSAGAGGVPIDRPHVHKLRDAGLDHGNSHPLNKGFYELLAEAVGDALGNPKQMDSFIKGMQEEIKTVPSRTNIDFFEHIAMDVAAQKKQRIS